MGQPEPPTVSVSLPVDQTTYAGSAFLEVDRYNPYWMSFFAATSTAFDHQADLQLFTESGGKGTLGFSMGNHLMLVMSVMRLCFGGLLPLVGQIQISIKQCRSSVNRLSPVPLLSPSPRAGSMASPGSASEKSDRQREETRTSNWIFYLVSKTIGVTGDLALPYFRKKARLRSEIGLDGSSERDFFGRDLVISRRTHLFAGNPPSRERIGLLTCWEVVPTTFCPVVLEENGRFRAGSKSSPTCFGAFGRERVFWLPQGRVKLSLQPRDDSSSCCYGEQRTKYNRFLHLSGSRFSFFLFLTPPRVVPNVWHFPYFVGATSTNSLMIKLQPKIYDYIMLTICISFIPSVCSQVPVIVIRLQAPRGLSVETSTNDRHFLMVFPLLTAAFSTPPDIWCQIVTRFLISLIIELAIFVALIVQVCEEGWKSGMRESGSIDKKQE
ncbi:hypothetical protein Ddye_011160 [Dipteronia dyeriana]|uniref:Transport membrane protein n=1 Tax=Dipteronia dyeriana TaxID=168575 RepID=A0AAE0CPH3_9ROSI|nr:hypothetical protein Ddye_011160 [Dipteronia dyeriana]